MIYPKYIREIREVIRNNKILIFDVFQNQSTPILIDNVNDEDTDGYCSYKIYELLEDIPTPQMFVAIYHCMRNKDFFLKDIKNVLQNHLDLKISEDFKKYISNFLEMMFI